MGEYDNKILHLTEGRFYIFCENTETPDIVTKLLNKKC